MLTEHDALSRYCPILGHDVPFSYCRRPGQEIPCRKIFDCWWETFDIKSFIANNYSEDIQKAIAQPPIPKILSLLEIIEQAGRRNAAAARESERGGHR
jgi:hypothetical protein